MARKNYHAASERDYRPGLRPPPPLSMTRASRLHECAVALREQGRHAEAATCAQYALAYCARECGPEHPDVAMTLSNLAVLLRHRAAMPMPKRCISRPYRFLSRRSDPPIRTSRPVFRTTPVCYETPGVGPRPVPSKAVPGRHGVPAIPTSNSARLPTEAMGCLAMTG
jgi:hypothetical protein